MIHSIFRLERLYWAGGGVPESTSRSGAKPCQCLEGCAGRGPRVPLSPRRFAPSGFSRNEAHRYKSSAPTWQPPALDSPSQAVPDKLLQSGCLFCPIYRLGHPGNYLVLLLQHMSIRWKCLKNCEKQKLNINAVEQRSANQRQITPRRSKQT